MKSTKIFSQLILAMALIAACTSDEEENTNPDNEQAQSVAQQSGISSEEEAGRMRLYLRSDSSTALVNTPFRGILRVENGENVARYDLCSNTTAEPVIEALISNQKPYVLRLESCDTSEQYTCLGYIPTIGSDYFDANNGRAHMVLATDTSSNLARICSYVQTRLDSGEQYPSNEEFLALTSAIAKLPTSEQDTPFLDSILQNVANVSGNAESIQKVINGLFSIAAVTTAASSDYGSIIDTAISGSEIEAVWPSNPIEDTLKNTDFSSLSKRARIIMAVEIWMSRIAFLSNNFDDNLKALVALLYATDPVAKAYDWSLVDAGATSFPWDEIAGASDPCPSGYSLSYVDSLGFYCGNDGDGTDAYPVTVDEQGSTTVGSQASPLIDLLAGLIELINPFQPPVSSIGEICDGANCAPLDVYDGLYPEDYPSIDDYDPSSGEDPLQGSPDPTIDSSITSETFIETDDDIDSGGGSSGGGSSGGGGTSGGTCSSGSEGHSGQFCCGGNGQAGFCREGNVCNQATKTCSNKGSGCSLTIFCLH